MKQSAEKCIHISMHFNFAITVSIGYVTAKRNVVIRAFTNNDFPGIIVKDRHAQAFIHKVARINPVCELPETSHLLWTDNQTREEIVDSDENAGQNCSCSLSSDQTGEKLANIRVNSPVEREESPKGNTFTNSISQVLIRRINDSRYRYEDNAKEDRRDNDKSLFSNRKSATHRSTTKHTSSFMAIVHVSDREGYWYYRSNREYTNDDK
mmetsp:Transcript_42105/g.88444  ORF Transcript_42105/g.88444 Transcript_42105/m.88444 type:complete len:209 (-) Transcript_42105:473-1099(-)